MQFNMFSYFANLYGFYVILILSSSNNNNSIQIIISWERLENTM